MEYTIKKGDNLSSIAKKNGLKLSEIVKLNNISNPDYIQAGQKIKLPNSTNKSSTVTLVNKSGKPNKEWIEDQLKTNSSKWQGATKKSNSAPQLYKNFNQAEEKPVAKITLNKPVKKTTTVKKEVNEKDDSSLFEDINNTISKYSQMASTTYKRKIKPLFEDKYDDENSTTKMNLQTPKKVITYDNITGSPIKDPEMGADIYHRSRYIDLNNPEIKTGIHNRGTKIKGDQPFKQILFSNFDNKKFESINPSNIKDDSFYIGQDDTGKIIMGNGKDLKSKKGSISEFSIIKDITGFSKINNNIETSKSKDAKRANNPYLVNDKNEKVPLNILSSTDDNGNDKYGQWYGGSLIVTSPDMKKKVLISGSLNEVNQGLEKFKKDNNLSKVHVVKVDNGSYSRQFATQNPKGVNQEFWSKYEGLNTSGGNNLYEYEHGGNITAETIYSMSEQPKVILTPDDIKAESGFNFQKYFPMERDIPIDTTTSYNRDIDRFAWKNTLQSYPQLQELQKQQQHPQQIDSSYYTTKTPKGYLNVYDKSNKFVGYSLDNKTIIPLEPNFEDGGMIKAWVQKFSPGGTPNPYIDPYVGMTEFNPEIETNMQSMPFQKLQTQPINQSFNNLQPKQFNTQMQVPLAQSNMQPYSTPYQTNYNASNDQVNMDNKQADSMMGGDKMSKMNPADMALGAANMVGDVASGAINAFAKPGSKASAYAEGSAKAQSVVKPLEKIPIVGQASKLISGIIGGALNARKQGIEDEETAKKDKQLEYLTRNTMNVNQPSYYGQYMAKYGANPKMMEQRVIDDIYSDFDKYMKLT